MTELERIRGEIGKVLPTTNLCEICYLHKPGNYTRKDCITYGKRLCAYEDMMVNQVLSIKGLAILEEGILDGASEVIPLLE